MTSETFRMDTIWTPAPKNKKALKIDPPKCFITKDFIYGADGGTRTHDLLITSELL